MVTTASWGLTLTSSWATRPTKPRTTQVNTTYVTETIHSSYSHPAHSTLNNNDRRVTFAAGKTKLTNQPPVMVHDCRGRDVTVTRCVLIALHQEVTHDIWPSCLNNGPQPRMHCQTFPLLISRPLDCLTAWMINWFIWKYISPLVTSHTALDVEFLQQQQQPNSLSKEMKF